MTRRELFGTKSRPNANEGLEDNTPGDFSHKIRSHIAARRGLEGILDVILSRLYLQVACKPLEGSWEIFHTRLARKKWDLRPFTIL